MTEIVGGVVGVILAIMGVWWSRHIAQGIDATYELSRYASGALLAVGGTSGALAAREPGVNAALLAIVLGLLVVQAPVDLALHRLARTPTVLATVLVVNVYGVVVVDCGWQQEFIVAFGSAVGVVALFSVLQRMSPRSLGWGDVLLVVPLALAVALVEVSKLPLWLVIASGTAAVHGVLLRWRRGEQMLPFGPHLLSAAWLVIALSV